MPTPLTIPLSKPTSVAYDRLVVTGTSVQAVDGQFIARAVARRARRDEKGRIVADPAMRTIEVLAYTGEEPPKAIPEAMRAGAVRLSAEASAALTAVAGELSAALVARAEA